MKKRPLRIKQQGAAIIVALFVTSLAAIAAVAMIERLRVDVHRTERLIDAEQNYLYAEGSVAWAIETLNENFRRKKANHVIDLTPIKSPVDYKENATIYSVIEDQEGRFNLNNLSSPEYEKIFTKLIQSVNPEISQETAQHLTEAVRDWVSQGTSKTSYDDYYLKQNPPYRAPHRFMASVSELRLVQGITPSLYIALLPNITALPEVTKININNAPAAVLMSLSPTLTYTGAKTLTDVTKNKPFADIPGFMAHPIVKNHPFPDKKISTISSYFLVKTNVKVGDQETILFTLLHRENKNSEPFEVVLWQTKGTL